MATKSEIIGDTKKWITDVVIGCNFCPFANKVVRQSTVEYCVEENSTMLTVLETLRARLEHLEADALIETTFIMLPNGFADFMHFLDLVEKGEKLIKKNGFEGIYQLASFHPKYLFAGSTENDAANYTNRSPYAMLHILREHRIEEALKLYANPERIPENNIAFARQKGLVYMKMLRDSCIG